MSEEIQRVEVITSVQRRRRWSVAEKIRLVEETLPRDSRDGELMPVSRASAARGARLATLQA